VLRSCHLGSVEICSTKLCSLPKFLDNFTKVLLTSFQSCSAKFSNPQKLYDYYHWLLYSGLPGTRSTIPHYPPSHLLVHHHPRQTDAVTEIPSAENMASGTFSRLAPQTCLLRAMISITNFKWVRRPGFSRVALFCLFPCSFNFFGNFHPTQSTLLLSCFYIVPQLVVFLSRSILNMNSLCE
jgi:hypothetical protein